SKRQAREWLENGAIRVNGERVQQEGGLSGFALFDRYYVLQRGKKQFALIKLEGLAE
ncbi:S4 domain-containing protein, partial [Klebsiella pneumoniae]